MGILGGSKEKDTSQNNSSPQTAPLSAEELDTALSEAYGLLNEAQDFEAAVDKFSAILAIDPAQRESLRGMAAAHYNMQDHEKGIDYIDLAISHHPDDFEANRMRGVFYKGIGNDEEAAKSFSRTLELDPERDDVRLQLIECIKYDDSERALLECDALLAKNPENTDALCLKGRIFADDERDDEAAQIARLLLASKSENAEDFIWAGQILEEAKDEEAMINAFVRAFELGDDSGWGDFYYGFVMMKQDQIEDGFDQMLEGAQIVQDRIGELGHFVYITGGDLLKKHGHNKQAKIFYKTYLDIAGPEAGMYQNIKQIHDSL